MKKHLVLPLITLLGGVAAFILRLLQNRTGYEPDTGLPIPSAPMGLALIALFAALVTVLFILVRRIPQRSAPIFPLSFSTADPRFLMLPVTGILLLGLSGLVDAAIILAPEAVPGTILSIPPTIRLLFAATSLFSAIALFPAAAACREKDSSPTVNETLLLVPPVCLVVRLVLTYRFDSIDPVLQNYYIGLLALVFLTMAFYRLSSFAFDSGRSRRFVFYSAVAVIMSTASLADGGQLSDLLLYAGASVVLLGFMLLHLFHIAETPLD